MSENVESLLHSLQDTNSKRVETLRRLAHHFRSEAKNHVAMIFLREAFRICTTREDLHALMDELSIIGFYANERRAAKWANQFCILMPHIPPPTRRQALHNEHFYLDALCVDRRSHQKLTVQMDEPYVPSNSCLLHDTASDRVVGIVRGVNYSINDHFRYSIRDPEGHLRSTNYWCEIEPDGTVVNSYPIRFQSEAVIRRLRSIHIHGLEDIRICFVGNQLYALAIDWEHCRHPNASMLLCHLNKDEHDQYVITKAVPILYQDHLMQKNWVLFTRDQQLFAVYSHHPLVVLHIDPENGAHRVVTEKFHPTYVLDQLRGSANPIRNRTDDGWLVLTHEVIDLDTRKYVHRFVEYDEPFEQVTRISEPFFFCHLFIEFSLSMFRRANSLTIVFSTRDNSLEWLHVNEDELPWLPTLDAWSHPLSIEA